MFNNYEKIERVLFQTGNLQIKNTVLFGAKTADGKKAEPINNRTYPSTKYTNKNELNSLTIKSSDFLVFSYNDYEKRLNEEVYLSYGHLDDLETFFGEIVELLQTDGVFDQNGMVSQQYSDLTITSGTFGSGKKLYAIPDSFTNRDDQVEEAITLFLNREEFAVTISMNALKGILRILNSLNLITHSNQLITMALGDSIERASRTASYGSRSSENDFNSGSMSHNTGNSTFNRRGLTGRTSSGIGGRKIGGINKNRFSDKLNTPNKNNEIVEQENTNISQSEESVMTSQTQQPKNNKVGNKPLGIGNILATADEIDINDGDEIDV